VEIAGPRVLAPAFWSGLTFSWATPLLALGSRRQLQQEDLYALPADLQPSACGRLLWRKWEEVRPVTTGMGRAAARPVRHRVHGQGFAQLIH
jgi:hypothetical protein